MAKTATKQQPVSGRRVIRIGWRAAAFVVTLFASYAVVVVTLGTFVWDVPRNRLLWPRLIIPIAAIAMAVVIARELWAEIRESGSSSAVRYLSLSVVMWLWTFFGIIGFFSFVRPQ